MTIFFCLLAALCEGFDIQAAGVAAVGLSRELTPSAEQLGIFFSAGNFGLFLGAMVGGRLADRIGRGHVLVVSLAVFGALSLLTSFAWSVESITWMRLFTGFGLGGAMPNLIALAIESSKSRSRYAGMAMTYIGMPIGGTLASLAVVFTAVEHWRWVFLIGGLSPLVVAAAIAMLMPLPPPTWNRPAAGQAASRDGALRELFARKRLPRTALLCVGFFLIQVTLQVMLNWLPLLMQGRGLSKSEAAFAQMGFNTGGAAIALLMGYMLDRGPRSASIAACTIGLPAVLLMLANAPAQSTPLVTLASLLGGGVLACQIILYAAADTSYPPAMRGTVLGLVVGVGRLGAIAGPTFAAVLVGAGHTPQQVLMGILPLAIVCCVCVALLGHRNSRGQADERVAPERWKRAD